MCSKKKQLTPKGVGPFTEGYNTILVRITALESLFISFKHTAYAPTYTDSLIDV